MDLYLCDGIARVFKETLQIVMHNPISIKGDLSMKAKRNLVMLFTLFCLALIFSGCSSDASNSGTPSAASSETPAKKIKKESGRCFNRGFQRTVSCIHHGWNEGGGQKISRCSICLRRWKVRLHGSIGSG